MLSLDLAHQEKYDDFINRAFQKWGTLDIWVNNAGVDLLTGDQAKLGYDAKLEKLFDIDVRGTVLLSREVGRRMSEQGHGCILNIGWDQSDRGMEGASGELFATSKNAIMGFSRSLAVSLAPKVRVNCIAPGWILTAWGESASEVWQERVKQDSPGHRQHGAVSLQSGSGLYHRTGHQCEWGRRSLSCDYSEPGFGFEFDSGSR
jgi:3-oxoacyl-[acyl-carrier protein] reductase